MFQTDFLVAKNSFLSGMGMVLDLGATRRRTSYNESRTSEEADSRAILNDWQMTGSDIRGAMNEFEKDYKTKSRKQCCAV